jgi:predicted CXXCH cytochrome family protein
MEKAPGCSKSPDGNHLPRQRRSRIIAIRIWRPLALAVVLTSGLRLHAGEHPVPLDPKTDTAKCLECHENKAKGKHVHTAVAMGCTSCHEIRVSKDVTRVKLITATPAALCFTCHADKNPADIKGTVHKPAVRDCLKCHDPHASENENQLLKPASGGQKENLCLSCHAIGVHTPATGSRHAALDMGCDSCHLTHKTGPSSDLEFTKHLKKAPPALCVECHDVKDAILAKAHQNQPFEKAECVSCHSPHESDKPKLMQAFTHPPFADKQCDTCHEPAKQGKVVLTAAGSKDLCVMCHSEQAKTIETAKVQHPGAMMSDCTDCHSPHASREPGLPKTSRVDVCLSCHAEQADMQKTKKVHHQPAFQQGCSTCHEPHGGDNGHLLRAKEVNTLCLECHGPDSPQPTPVKNQPLIAIFDGKVRLPQDYFKKVPILPIRYNTGHPVDGHPVANTVNLNTKTPVALSCLSCHQPHASVAAGLLIKDQEANMAFCKTCHTEGTLRLGNGGY